jgi:hypothetical protein
MAFRQLFPLKDATIYSNSVTKNTGLDPILEFTKSNPYNAARILIEFDKDEVDLAVAEAGANPVKSYLRMYASEVSSLATKMPIIVNKVSEAWVMGTGRDANSPITTDGVSWLGPRSASFWITASGVSTGSYISGSANGGGSWLIGSSSQQTITEYTTKDLYIDITNQLDANFGYILRVSESVESDPAYQYDLSYFSRDTNTIYPPSLFIFWNDSVYNPHVTLGQQVLNNQNFDVTLGNNDGNYYAEDNVQIQVYARDRYPQRQFVTSSLYEWNKMLPSQSFYQVVDVDTNDVIIPFNDPGTLISTTTGSYFQLNMNQFEPNRYYQVQVKVNISGSTYIKATDNMTFKVSQTVGP